MAKARRIIVRLDLDMPDEADFLARWQATPRGRRAEMARRCLIQGMQHLAVLTPGQSPGAIAVPAAAPMPAPAAQPQAQAAAPVQPAADIAAAPETAPAAPVAGSLRHLRGIFGD